MDSSTPSSTPLSDAPQALPQLPGPKLAPFTPTAHADIEFIEQLGNPAEDMDSFVWKVRINGMAPYYALKMFQFNAALYLESSIGSYLNRPLASPQLWIDYFDPFRCECRAYGRLKEECREDIAVRAHGYLFLTPEQELEVAKRSTPIQPDDAENDDPWGRAEEPLVADRPVHAIVKDLATDNNHFTRDQIDHLWRDLEDFHKLGILVRDVTVSNYIGGKLIDLSRAWTVPHPSLEYIHERYLRQQRRRDPVCLQNCIIDVGIDDGWNLDEVDMKELDACAIGEGENDGYGIDPRRYDWRKWEDHRTLEATEAFLEHEIYAPPPPEDPEAEGDEEE
ncbi:kinetochore Sim4 complex subunit FTA2-domain-containing protein [Chaetomidium leptoderma]|uniref:Kinetochore Sim4 complex subunit FTA2-domain-containing protein n=1 Tax=Chaetomidium leptoderma TaxID=669021 RepID=A0AAN6ZTY7_9PEZI|nr:kinetochore Sim4 complex subunit FTA2-domain-containing protein [Chaetomidium leptoderma]